MNTAIIMAAGKGKRMQPLTLKIPKALVKFKGKTLIEHVLNELNGTGIQRVIIVIGYKGTQVTQFLGKKFKGMELGYVWQKKQLGTADAVQQGLKKVGNEHFLVLSADVIVGKKDLKKLMNAKGDAVLGLRKTNAPERYGIVEIGKNRNVIKLIEKPKKVKGKIGWINVGVYQFGPGAIPFIKNVTRNKKRGEFELTDAIRNMVKNGKKVVGVKFTEKVYDIGNLADLKKIK